VIWLQRGSIDMSITAMKLALEALEGVVSAHNYEGGAPVKAITALRDAIERVERPQTHSEECWRWHHQCAVARIEREQAQPFDMSAFAHRLKSDPALAQQFFQSAGILGEDGELAPEYQAPNK
jgi:hypothetical protein